ncbi:MAG TPA: hypothetical protein VGR37_01885 [Longimicrobiaceae bacterium]|nr:hypothetical protein [Longimicrobiaceae bacterium]
MSASILYLGMDVHKDSLTIAVFAPAGQQPLHFESSCSWRKGPTRWNCSSGRWRAA